MIKKLTLKNCVNLLMNDDTLKIKYIYSYKTTKFWEIIEDIPVILSNGLEIVIPKGMVTDFCTVPKFLWGIFPPYGDFLLASIIHDYIYIYRPEGYTREMADKEMLLWSNALCDNKIDNKIRYWAAKLLGWTYWDKVVQYKRELKNK